MIEWCYNVFHGGFDGILDALLNILGNLLARLLTCIIEPLELADSIFGTNLSGGLEQIRNLLREIGKNEEAVTWDDTLPNLDYKGIATEIYDNVKAWVDEQLESFKIETEEQNLALPVQNEVMGTGYAYGGWNPYADSEELSCRLDEESRGYLQLIAEKEPEVVEVKPEVTVNVSNVMNISKGMDENQVFGRFVAMLGETMNMQTSGMVTVR